MADRSGVHILTHQTMAEHRIGERRVGRSNAQRGPNHAGAALPASSNLHRLNAGSQVQGFIRARKQIQKGDLDLRHSLRGKLIEAQCAGTLRDFSSKGHRAVALAAFPRLTAMTVSSVSFRSAITPTQAKIISSQVWSPHFTVACGSGL